MSGGHHHNSNAGTQNQGNSLGDRACVRQSKLYRQHESGNDVKSILGTDHLRWDTEHQEGAYKGQKVFDHNKPNNVSNETRARSSEMKANINSQYSNDWSTESGSNKGYGQAPASMRDSYRSNEYDDNAVTRSKYPPANDYPPAYDEYQQYGNSGNNSGRQGRNGGGNVNASSMGGQSLSQFQSESAAYVQPAPRQGQSGRGSGNSDGFQSTLNQADRGNEPSFQSTRGAPQRSNSRNNIYGGSEETPSYGNPSAQYRQKDNQYSAPVGYGQGQTKGQVNYAPERAGPPRGQYQPHSEYEDDNYNVPGIANEGAGNREGRSTRPW